MTSSVAIRHALVAQKSCVILATHNLDSPTLSPLELLDGYQEQKHAERGFRCLKDPLVLASSLSRKKPQRIMALLMVMTVCWLVYAALEYRIRNALTVHQTTFPNQKGQLGQNPTARWVFQYFVGIHLLHMPGEGAFVLNLNDQHRQLLRRLGRRYEVFYSRKDMRLCGMSAEPLTTLQSDGIEPEFGCIIRTFGMRKGWLGDHLHKRRICRDRFAAQLALVGTSSFPTFGHPRAPARVRDQEMPAHRRIVISSPMRAWTEHTAASRNQ
jgi:hypothetical protein